MRLETNGHAIDALDAGGAVDLRTSPTKVQTLRSRIRKNMVGLEAIARHWQQLTRNLDNPMPFYVLVPKWLALPGSLQPVSTPLG